MVGIAAVGVEGTARHVGNVLSQDFRHEFFRVHAFRQRYPREQAAFGVCKGDAFREVFLHRFAHQVAAFLIEGLDLGDVFIEVEHIDVVRSLALAEGRRLEVDGLFQLDDFIDDDRIGYHPGNTQARHEDLRERAEENDIALGIHRLQGRYLVAVIAQFAIGVVFEDREVILVDEVHESLAPFYGPGDARRILEFRDDVHHADAVAVFFQNLFQFFRDNALFIRRYFDEFRFAELKGVEGAEVGRAFDENDVARVNEDLGQHGQTLLGPRRNSDVIDIAVDHESLFHAGCNLFAQGVVTFCRAVLQGFAAFFGQDGVVNFFQLFRREEFRCRQAASKGNDFRHGRQFQEFTDFRGFQIHG